MAIIDIPYVSQLENGARKFHNDCGAASGVMLVKAYKGSQNLTVDEYYDQTGQRKDQYLSASQVMSVLSRHGIPSKWRTGVSESDVRLLLDNKRPMIVLYNYKIRHVTNIHSCQMFSRLWHWNLFSGRNNKNYCIHYFSSR